MTYDPRKDAAESYNEAIKQIRMQKILAGEINPIVREVNIGDARLLQGDCAEIMLTLEPVSHVISDPPYEADAHRKTRKITGKNRGTIANAFSFGSIEDTRFEVAKLAIDLCQGWFLAFCMAEGVAPWRDAIEEAGAKYKRAMVWIKPDAMPQFNGQGPAAGFESIVAAWCGSGYSKWNGGGRVGTFVFNKNTGGKHQHETQKPTPLMKELVKLFTDEGQTVLDCFAGSGTTGVACVKLGRKFIGIEKDPTYFDVMVDRITKAYAQPDFFVAPPEPKPVQEELL